MKKTIEEVNNQNNFEQIQNENKKLNLDIFESYPQIQLDNKRKKVTNSEDPNLIPAGPYLDKNFGEEFFKFVFQNELFPPINQNSKVVHQKRINYINKFENIKETDKKDYVLFSRNNEEEQAKMNSQQNDKIEKIEENENKNDYENYMDLRFQPSSFDKSKHNKSLIADNRLYIDDNFHSTFNYGSKAFLDERNSTNDLKLNLKRFSDYSKNNLQHAFVNKNNYNINQKIRSKKNPVPNSSDQEFTQSSPIIDQEKINLAKPKKIKRPIKSQAIPFIIKEIWPGIMEKEASSNNLKTESNNKYLKRFKMRNNTISNELENKSDISSFQSNLPQTRKSRIQQRYQDVPNLLSNIQNNDLQMNTMLSNSFNSKLFNPINHEIKKLSDKINREKKNRINPINKLDRIPSENCTHNIERK